MVVKDVERRLDTVLFDTLLHDLGKDGSFYFQMTECWEEQWICWMIQKGLHSLVKKNWI